MTEKEIVIQELRHRLPEYMAQRGQVVGSKGKRLIRCVNPTHHDHTPSMCYYPRTEKLHCFGCGQTYDLFDLIAMDYPACDSFAKQVKRACEIFGLPNPFFESVEEKLMPPMIVQTLPLIKEEETIKNDLTVWLESAVAECGTGGRYFAARGIPQALCDKYRLFEKEGYAYLPIFEEGHCASYCARATEETAKLRYKNSSGKMQIFGGDALMRDGEGAMLFITEAIFDALSIEACGFEAVALCGAANVPRFLALCAQNPAIANSYTFVTAGDADAAGARMNEALREGLRQQGLVCSQLTLPTGCKDVNEALCGNPQLLRELLETVAQEEYTAYQKKSAGAYLDAFLDHALCRSMRRAVPTGFSVLDELLDGGLYAGLYVLGAVSSLGKTSFLLQMADTIAAGQNDVLFFSLEMSRFELIAKSLSRITCEQNCTSALTMREVLQAPQESSLRTHPLQQALEVYRTTIGPRLYLQEGIADIGAAEIRAAVQEHIRLRRRKPVVIVDYLQILKPADLRATDKQNTDRAVVELKRISRDFDLPVFAISSFNRENYRSAVTMEAFKESGAVEYSSDLLFGLQPAGIGEPGFDINAAKKREPRQVELVLLKNRSGRPYAKIAFDYDAKHALFQEKRAPRGKNLYNMA